MTEAAVRLRTIPAGFDAQSLTEVDRRLVQIEAEHQVAIGVAIESGSRAWGFPSPDSDYDCRFLFVRRIEDYLSPWPLRDVIETPLIDEMDVNGWELGKALKLLLKGNAVVIEWLTSPIRYAGHAWFLDEMLDFATAHSSRTGVARHYLHLGERQRRTYFADEKSVKMKKLFYALRPAAALRWLRLHPDRTLPPMDFPTLMAECDPPADVRALSEELIRLKSQTRELGTSALPKVIDDFMTAEFEAAREALGTESVRSSGEAQEAARDLFRRSVRRLAREAGSSLSISAREERATACSDAPARLTRGGMGIA